MGSRWKETAQASMTESDPQQIAQRAAQRDTEAFAELYHENLNAVYRFVFFKVGDGALAEDLTADVFAKAWEGIDRFQWRDLPFQHWLLRIARNVVVDHWRSRRRFTISVTDRHDAVSEVESPEDAVARDIEVEGLRRGLSKLPDDQRDVLILRFIEGFSHAETAKVVGKSTVAVRQIQVRALRALRQVMYGGDQSIAIGAASRLRAIARRSPQQSEEPVG
jgi:RNA polymerase sigma-70 factor (ECF subfamily)